MVVMVMGLEVLMNHIGIHDEDIMGSYVGSFDGITYFKKGGSFMENLLNKSLNEEVVG